MVYTKYNELGTTKVIVELMSSHNHAVLPNVNMTPNCSGFYDRISTDMNMIPNLHRIIIEVSSIGLIWRSAEIRG